MMRRDVIVGRRGDSITGQVQDKSFAIEAAFGRIRVETKRITWVHFEDKPDVPRDEIWLKNGDRLTGKVEPRTVRFRAASGEMLTVPRSAIHSILVGAGIIAGASGLR
jgi:hypothetical protein